jgi:diguanylate cyclase
MTLSKRFYVPRCIGLSLGFLAVYTSLPSAHENWQVLAMLIFYCFAWPHLAYLFAKANARPARAERFSMLIDACAAGFFSGAIGLNPIPSTAIVTMVSMNNMAMGGPRFLIFGILASMLGATSAYVFLGITFNAALSQSQVAACLPLLVLYPLSLGYVCYRTAVKLTKQKMKLSQMSRTDYLTGLTNRAALNDILDESFRAPAFSLENSVLALIDVDGFKQINDKYGHSAGDRALQEVSRTMLACVRDYDTVARYGGDEFCVILRNVNKDEAGHILERMRSLMHENASRHGGVQESTLSIGASAYDAGTSSSAMWIHMADTAMYQAKKDGRNKVVFTA